MPVQYRLTLKDYTDLKSADLLEIASIHRLKQYGITRTPTARFPSLERFGRRPKYLWFVMGRHPKSFTEAEDVWISSKRS